MVRVRFRVRVRVKVRLGLGLAVQVLCFRGYRVVPGGCFLISHGVCRSWGVGGMRKGGLGLGVSTRLRGLGIQVWSLTGGMGGGMGLTGLRSGVQGAVGGDG